MTGSGCEVRGRKQKAKGGRRWQQQEARAGDSREEAEGRARREVPVERGQGKGYRKRCSEEEGRKA